MLLPERKPVSVQDLLRTPGIAVEIIEIGRFQQSVSDDAICIALL